MKGKIFLSGGGGIKDSFLLDKKFIQSLKRKKVLYIPLALERSSMGFEGCYDWIISALSPHSNDFIDIVMSTNLKDINQNININDFDGIYIGGGNTYKLLQHIYDTNFDKILISFIKNGGNLYGGSAGAIILGKSIATVSEENDKNYQYNKGLSLIGNYSILCHYKENNNKILRFIENYQCPIIALSEGSGLIINDRTTEIVGGNGTVIFQSNKEKIYKQPGEIIDYILLTV